MAVTISGTTGVSQVQDGIITPAKTQVGALPSMVTVTASATSYGSTNTLIRRYTNNTNGVLGCIIQGTDITFADSATLGSSFTINASGVYAVSRTESGGTTQYIGLSLNTTQPTTSINSLTNAAEGLAIGYAGSVGIVCTTKYFPAGSVIRAHDTGQTGATTSPIGSQMTIVRMA